jgi:DNA repair protein RadC
MLVPVARSLQRCARVLTDDVTERPRERLLEHGAHALASNELLALVLGSGVAGKTAAELAAHLLEHAGSLATLSRADARELATLHGIGIARATRLVAAFQLGRRAGADPPRDCIVRNPDDVYRYLLPRVRGLMQEVFIVVALDARNAIVQHVEIARGSLTAVEVHPREVFRPLVRLAAAGAVVAHNHPSGDPTPSDRDIALTRRLRRAGDLMGIPVLEHVVIGAEGYASIGELVGTDDADWEGEW